MRINTNISAITANNSLQKAQENLSNSIKRLSSGYKINSSADDPAGCAISEKMRLQIRGLDQADNNAADGESVLNTAEGALQEINAMLSRMKELSVQAANDVNSDNEREAIQQELDAINSEIDRITSQTEYNTQPLLNGNLSRRVYSETEGVTTLEVSDNFTAGNYDIKVTKDAKQAVVQGNGVQGSGSTLVGESGTVSINGYKVSISADDTYDTAISKLQEGAAKAGVECFLTNDTSPDKKTNGVDNAGYSASPTGTLLTFATNGYGSDESLTIECAEPLASKLGLSKAAVSGGFTDTGEDVQAEFTSPRGNFADSAVISTDGTVITVTDVNNRKLKLDVPGDVAASNVDGVTITEEITDIGTMSIHIGANQDQTIELDIPAVTSYTIGTDTINVMTSMTAQKAIAQVDEAINTVNAVRSKIGAYSNRFEHTRANLSVSSENAESALSTMMDTEMADEMTTYTSLNVLTQAATSILSQANERPSTVLQILQ
jgi:flagellin